MGREVPVELVEAPVDRVVRLEGLVAVRAAAVAEWAALAVAAEAVAVGAVVAVVEAARVQPAPATNIR